MTRHRWTDNQVAILRACYADMPTANIARQLGIGARAVHSKANALGLHKSAAFMAHHHGRVLAAAGVPTRFEPGAVPWNKGTRFVAGGRSPETRFGPGNRPHTWVPVGSTRTTKDGYLQRKVSDTGYTPRDWVAVHRLVWEAAHGPMPNGHVVVFRPGCRTADERQITIDRVELVSRRDLMARNSAHRHTPELFRLSQLRGAITRQINRRLKDQAKP